MKNVFVLCMQSGRTLLHFAAELDHREAVECLLEKKADADAKDKVNNILNFMVRKLCVGYRFNIDCWLVYKRNTLHSAHELAQGSAN